MLVPDLPNRNSLKVVKSRPAVSIKSWMSENCNFALKLPFSISVCYNDNGSDFRLLKTISMTIKYITKLIFSGRHILIFAITKY